jgi:hypothetical protein
VANFRDDQTIHLCEECGRFCVEIVALRDLFCEVNLICGKREFLKLSRRKKVASLGMTGSVDREWIDQLCGE